MQDTSICLSEEDENSQTDMKKEIVDMKTRLARMPIDQESLENPPYCKTKLSGMLEANVEASLKNH
jgi:hypothetical protein